MLHWKRGGHKAVCEGGGGGSKEEEEESKKEEVHYEGVVFPGKAARLSFCLPISKSIIFSLSF